MNEQEVILDIQCPYCEKKWKKQIDMYEDAPSTVHCHRAYTSGGGEKGCDAWFAFFVDWHPNISVFKLDGPIKKNKKAENAPRGEKNENSKV